METKIVKLFKNGSSQAVRLPAEFRFQGSEVYATRDERTGDVTLSDYPGRKAWNDFFDLVDTLQIPESFMSERPLNRPPVERDLFAGARGRSKRKSTILRHEG